jgi:hypothetical protein
LRNYLRALSLGVAALFLIAGCASAATIENPNFQDVEDSESQPTSAGQETASPSPETTVKATAEKPKQEDLSVVETYFWPADDYERWYFVAYIENPNEDFAWISESFDFEAYEAEGILLDSSVEYATILPNSTAVFYGYWFDIGNNIVTEMDVRGVTSGTLLDSPTGNFEVESIEYSNGRFSSEVSGVIVSNFESDQESVEVVVVIRDSSGTILTADSGYVSRVPAGGKARYEISLYDFEVLDSMEIEVHPKL